MKYSNIVKLIVSLAVSLSAGVIGSLFTTPAIPEWYAELAKPALAPPNWIFAPVWITLFIMMGIAAYLVWQKGWEKVNVKIAMFVFGIQLILNTLWSIIFFGLQNPGLAFMEIIFLLAAILATIIVFHRIAKPAAYLLIPYITWVGFAAYLNYSIWMLN